MLQDSLEVWAEEGRRVAWIRVPIDKGWCTPMAAKQGFTLHHALDDTLMLVRWLSQEEENKVPHYPHNYVGVGAAVLRQGGSSGPQLLVVTERYSDGTLDRWKLPGGMVEPGQGIGEAAERECLEETGIQAEFMSLLGVRHSHGVAFGRSDLYFVALLRPTDPDQPIQLDPSEISKCQWMELDTFAADPNLFPTPRWTAHQLQRAVAALDRSQLRCAVDSWAQLPRWPGVQPTQVPSWDGRSTALCYGVFEEQEEEL